LVTYGVGIKLIFQDTLSGTKPKTRVLYCKYPLCDVNQLLSKKHDKRTLASVYYLISDQGTDTEKHFCYICKECSYYDFSNFGRPLTYEALNLQTYIIPDSYSKSFSKLIEPRSSQKCLFCTQDKIINYDYEDVYKLEIEDKERMLKLDLPDKEKEELENEIAKLKTTTKPIYKIIPCVYKLFTKQPSRRNYVGFLCLVCNAIYYDTNFKDIDWKQASKKYKKDRGIEDRTINPFSTWNKIYQEKAKEYKKLKKEEKKLDPKMFNQNYGIRMQELETWRRLRIKKPPEIQDEISIKYLGPQHTQSGSDAIRPERYDLKLVKLTRRKFIRAIKDYGSEEQKQVLIGMGYL